jgi:hypothetical protein
MKFNGFWWSLTARTLCMRRMCRDEFPEAIGLHVEPLQHATGHTLSGTKSQKHVCGFGGRAAGLPSQFSCVCEALLQPRHKRGTISISKSIPEALSGCLF